MHSSNADQTAATRRVILTPGIAAVVLTGLALYVAALAAHLLLLLFVAVLIATYLAAFTDAIAGRTRWNRSWAFVAAIVLTLLAQWGIEALLVPPVIEQTRALIAGLPRYVAAWQDWLGRLVTEFPGLDPFIGGDRQHEIVDAALGQAESIAAGIFPHVFNVAHGLINFVSVGVMAIYLARAPLVYADFVVSLTPPAHRDVARGVLESSATTLRSWLFAQLFNMVLLGSLTTIGLLILGVPYWLAFGIFAGLAAIVPFFGTLVSTLLPALFVLDRGPTIVVLVMLVGVVVHVLEGNVVSPMVFQRGVHLPPVLTIMAVLIGGSLAGPIGLVVAVPLLAVLLVLLRRILKERIYGDPPEPILAERAGITGARATPAAAKPSP